MIKDKSQVSLKNQELLNEIAAELAYSIKVPLMEFFDIMLESFMYPQDHSYSTDDLYNNQSLDSHSPDSSFNKMESNSINILGNSKILEIIYMKRLITQIDTKRASPDTFDFNYITNLVNHIGKIRSLLVHMVNEFKSYMKVPRYYATYRSILTESLSDFHLIFTNLKGFILVMEDLLSIAAETGISDDRIFQVNCKTIINIKKIIELNNTWFNELMIKSRAFKEYILVESIKLSDKEVTLLSQNIIPPTFIEAIYSSHFRHFLNHRKSHLMISHRKII